MRTRQLVMDRILEIEGEVHRLLTQLDSLAKHGNTGKFADIDRSERIKYSIKLYGKLLTINKNILEVLNGK